MGTFFAFLFLMVSETAQGGTLLMRGELLDGLGDARIEGFEKYIQVNSLNLSFAREMTDGKTGMTDNMTAATQPSITISKRLDGGSTTLLGAMLSGKMLKFLYFYFVDTSTVTAYLAYKMEDCIVKGWNTSADGDAPPNEEITLHCLKIGVLHRDRNGKFSPPAGWDYSLNKSYNPGTIIGPDGKPSM